MDRRNERGQTIVEFGMILSCLIILTAGLIDAGRAFFAFNAVSAAARYGARWASVVGGSCIPGVGNDYSSSDWCNGQGTDLTTSGSNVGTGAELFWKANGNAPLQGFAASCPSYTSSSSSYYTASTFNTSTTSSQSTIIGAILRHFDSNSSTSNTVLGNLTPGLDASKLKVCVALTSASAAQVQPGDMVTVTIYYPFRAFTGPLGTTQFPLVSTSQMEVE